METVLSFISEFCFFAPVLYILFVIIRILNNRNYLTDENIFPTQLKIFLFFQLSFHAHFLFIWLQHFQGNPYRKLYGDLNPLLTPIYFMYAIIAYFIFTCIVAFLLKRRELSNEGKTWISVAWRFLIYWAIAFTIQNFIAIKLARMDYSYKQKQESISTDEAKKIQPKVNEPVINKVEHNSNVEDAIVFPPDTLYDVMIMNTGSHHGDEIYAQAEVQNWWALMLKNNTYTLKPTDVIFEKVHDEIVDEQSEKTGVKVSMHDAGAATLLAGFNMKESNRIPFVELTKTEIYPGEELKFELCNKHYRVFAKGNTIIEDGGYKRVENYKLYLEDQAGIVQLLVATPTFDESMIAINFIGDIDQDQYPDFIIDTSNHYNRSSNTLYLSSFATKGLLVKVVAMHHGTGC